MGKNEFNKRIEQIANYFDIEKDFLIEQVNIPIDKIWELEYKVVEIDQNAKVSLIINKNEPIPKNEPIAEFSKIVIMDYAKKEVRIVNESEIETYILENEFNNDLKLFLLEYGFISPDCDFMVVDELKIRI